ncbi:hypothetical protein C8035_v008118 [Colletotrichum spinosum]|uniref:Uncharacterized protein n=1 Tax=Colletotrichum spinosum TaxID=1347390 RepID=A0A4R8QC03_9PEZI|nr:hypothetical protein C8035_v008118 [Colletotrichum spinosum]
MVEASRQFASQRKTHLDSPEAQLSYAVMLRLVGVKVGTGGISARHLSACSLASVIFIGLTVATLSRDRPWQ